MEAYSELLKKSFSGNFQVHPRSRPVHFRRLPHNRELPHLHSRRVSRNGPQLTFPSYQLPSLARSLRTAADVNSALTPRATRFAQHRIVLAKPDNSRTFTRHTHPRIDSNPRGGKLERSRTRRDFREIRKANTER